ncbi:hypothetical protein CY652_13820 [Burkholderia sp. WAC0059]|uniref:hypothetical protein n=1 Tax=Burkholderia sp. WAC0059 TaxID=2066022 RepID=UPI000C7F77F2|nr:hypothetical protein [Burkholderia sp. WAC0059]PLZ01755.1 hypothetical protein CY652_13820 [Burkholderia sp. WAC0059]
MEIREVISLAVPTVMALVGLLNYRQSVRARIEDARPRRAKPVLDLTHTVTYSSITDDVHSLRLDVSHREDKPIAIKELCWHARSFKTRWPLSYRCEELCDSTRLQDRKVEAADLLRLDIDIEHIFRPILGSRSLNFPEMIVAVVTLDIGVILTTGEVEVPRTPWTFRDYLATQIVRPRWLAFLVRMYIRKRFRPG